MHLMQGFSGGTRWGLRPYVYACVTMAILLAISACSGLQLEQAGAAAGTAAEVAGTAGAVTGNPFFLGTAIALGAISAGLTGVGRLMRAKGK